ncbi:MAG: GGDEF domain-containing protein, partial [bacterium]
KADSPIPEVGANEFRYLAQAYNKMYMVYKTSIDRLNFKASHDELTGVYNRAGYDLLLSSIDMDTTYMLLIDVDNFKAINDNYGHEVGDRALIRLAGVLRSSFRADDHICRIGGDEFVVFMVHSTEMQHKLIESKIERINSELEKSEDGLPPISISVGIVHGSQAADATALFEESDEAMYEAKRHGKHGYTFYTVRG